MEHYVSIAAYIAESFDPSSSSPMWKVGELLSSYVNCNGVASQ